ncbi:MAG TPA: hypothetical protein VFA89_06645 [Terriglobales bacterium]|nr:hypothetical protein [Terriglobales bacterium]
MSMKPHLVILIFTILLFGYLAPQVAMSEDAAQPTAVRQQNITPGALRIEFESGNYTIRASEKQEIVVTYHAATPEKLRAVKVEIKPETRGAEIFVRHTPNDDFYATIDVPRRSDLWVRLTAGDLKIEDIEGNKDLESNAGDITIEVPHPEVYSRVDASVIAGDIDARAFNVSKSGLFRSFHQSGSGKYRLHARLMAGDLIFSPGA